MAEGQTDEGFHVLTPWCPPLAGRACPAGAPLSFQKKAVGKKGRGASPALAPPVRGFMAAVGCTNRAEARRALPPVFLAVVSQALPRLGRHASGLPRKPWKWLRCTKCARRAAAGAMPPKYRGSHRSHP